MSSKLHEGLCQIKAAGSFFTPKTFVKKTIGKGQTGPRGLCNVFCSGSSWICDWSYNGLMSKWTHSIILPHLSSHRSVNAWRVVFDRCSKKESKEEESWHHAHAYLNIEICSKMWYLRIWLNWHLFLEKDCFDAMVQLIIECYRSYSVFMSSSLISKILIISELQMVMFFKNSYIVFWYKNPSLYNIGFKLCKKDVRKKYFLTSKTIYSHRLNQ